MDEMKKYIIEFSEDPHTIRLIKIKNGNVCPTTEFKTVTPYTEPDTGKIREKAYDEGYTRGAHDAKKVFEDHADEAYRKGLNDAWATARKIESLSAREFDKAFTGYDDCFKVFENYTPQEAIDKIRIAYENGLNDMHDEAYQKGYQDATVKISSDEQAIAEKAYQSGLNDAWMVARKIVCLISDGGFTQDLLDSIFGSHNHQRIMAQYSASDAIEKISKYEPEQTQIGDEVEGDFGLGMVTKPLEGGAYIMWKDGSSGSHTANEFRLTGRHFPELVEVLRKMEEK